MISSQTDWNIFSASTLKIAACSCGSYLSTVLQKFSNNYQIFQSQSIPEFEQYIQELPLTNLPEIILLEVDKEGKCFKLVEAIKKNLLLKGLIIVLIAENASAAQVNQVKKLKVHDFYYTDFTVEELEERLNFLVKFKLIKPNIEELSETVSVDYKMPLVKRLFDIVFACCLLLALSPILIIVAILVKLESKGPVIYKSKRVGTGYKIFDFYKFRSMRKDADAQLAKLSKELNQYAGETDKTAFVKLKNDPRITKLGHFLRNTSIDELPQIFNILKGDMSFVGNRPLPLYEAEMLTSNEWAMRFLAPAGLTGLWQISKRGKEDMSERERKKLDNFYAQKHSFWFDMKIILGTFPALFTKEKV